MEFDKPKNLKLSGSLAENFKIFKDEITVFFEATKTTSKPMKTQVARLLNLLGIEGLKLYRSFKTDNTMGTVDSILKILEEYCTPSAMKLWSTFFVFHKKTITRGEF